MEGRVEEEGVARAMGGLLGVLVRHARAVTVGGEAEEENCEEHAAAAGAGREVRWAGGEDWGWCTLYLGGEEDDPEVAPGEEPRRRARAGLGRGSEGEEQGGVRWATEEAARAKVRAEGCGPTRAGPPPPQAALAGLAAHGSKVPRAKCAPSLAPAARKGVALQRGVPTGGTPAD